MGLQDVRFTLVGRLIVGAVIIAATIFGLSFLKNSDIIKNSESNSQDSIVSVQPQIKQDNTSLESKIPAKIPVKVDTSSIKPVIKKEEIKKATASTKKTKKKEAVKSSSKATNKSNDVIPDF